MDTKQARHLSNIWAAWVQDGRPSEANPYPPKSIAVKFTEASAIGTLGSRPLVFGKLKSH